MLFKTETFPILAEDRKNICHLFTTVDIFDFFLLFNLNTRHFHTMAQANGLLKTAFVFLFSNNGYRSSTLIQYACFKMFHMKK